MCLHCNCRAQIETSLTYNSHVATVCSYVHRTRNILDKKLPSVYAFLIHSWESIQPGLCLPSLLKQRPLGFSHLLLSFSVQLALDSKSMHPSMRLRSQELIAETLSQQGMEPRPFDIGISKFWPCASRKPSRLKTEKSGSLPSPWNHNHTSVEEQDLCTIQASHAVLHKKNFDEGAILRKDVSQ
jgi:hypothetical protein